MTDEVSSEFEGQTSNASAWILYIAFGEQSQSSQQMISISPDVTETACKVAWHFDEICQILQGLKTQGQDRGLNDHRFW